MIATFMGADTFLTTRSALTHMFHHDLVEQSSHTSGFIKDGAWDFCTLTFPHDDISLTVSTKDRTDDPRTLALSKDIALRARNSQASASATGKVTNLLSGLGSP